MTMNVTSRGFFVKRHDFGEVGVRCSLAWCTTSATLQLGWRYDRKIRGKLIEVPTTRAACERHARLFAFKKGIPFPRAAA
jgi:hypothetical protein